MFLGWMIEGKWVDGKLVGAVFQSDPPKWFIEKAEQVFKNQYCNQQKKPEASKAR